MREVHRVMGACKCYNRVEKSCHKCPGKLGPLHDKDGEFVVLCSCPCHKENRP